MRILALLAVTSILLMSCTCHPLTVQTEYLRREKLASYFIHTPDPLLEDPLIGQRLIIEWSLSPCQFANEEIYIDFTLRFEDRSEISRRIEIYNSWGMYIFELNEKDFLERGGFLTYKVELFAGGQVIDEFQHQLWVPLIHVGEEEDLDE